jgi:hypothetical protein
VPTPDRLRPAPYVAGLAGAAAVALTGIWLIVAPFAVGYQPDGAEWVDATIIGVVTGAALVVLGLVTGIVLATALRAEARRHGLLPTTSPADAPMDSDPDEPSDPDDADAFVAGPADLESVLAPLAAALLEDLRNGHEERELDQLADHPTGTADHRPA